MPQHLRFNEQRSRKWSHLTEGIEDQHQKILLENLFENTQKYLAEATTTQDIAPFVTYAFPLIRRVFPNLVANELVAIQPMTMPTGKIFYMDYKYSSDVAPTKAGDNMQDIGKHNPYYGTGARGEVVDGEVNGTNKEFSVAIFPIVEDSLVAKVDSEEVTISEIDGKTGKFELVEAPESGSTVTVDYDIAHEGHDNAPEIEFELTDDTITAQQKRLKAKWTLESQQDLMAYHGVDAEVELITMLAEEIRREIDSMILTDLFESASININWSKEYDEELGYSRKEYDETLFDALIDAETEVYNKRFVKPNWIVADPTTCSRLEKLNGFRFDGDVTGGTIQKGINLQGTLRNKYRVYSDPRAMPNTLLLGYKGSNIFETGYVYSPYIPLYTTPTIMDTDFTPRRAVMSRFGKKVITNDFYAKVTITN